MFNKKITSRRAVTLVELVIVISLISMVSLTLYYALSNGLKVWQRNQQVVLEEKIVIFFEKMTEDLQNTYRYSQMPFQGNRHKFSFPVIMYAPMDKKLSYREDIFVDQMSLVEYYYDYTQRSIFKRKANYAQALGDRFGPEQLLVENVESFRFKYYYMTDLDEIYSEDILGTVPSRIEIEVTFFDRVFERKIKKFIDIPIGS